MKTYQNVAFPIKVKKRNTDPETINLVNTKDVFYTGQINIDALNIDINSNVIFLEEKKIMIENITIENGKMLLIDKDTIITGDLVIQSGGELRII